MRKNKAVIRHAIPDIHLHITRALAGFQLTPRELQVAELISSGMTNAQAARALGCKPSTVKTHVERLLLKVGVRNRRTLQQRVWHYLAREH